MRRPGTILLLAIVLGALSAAMVYRRLQVQEAQIEAARRAAQGATTQVVVAAESIPIGSVIEQRQVRLASWPVDLQPEQAMRKPDAVVGAIAKVTIEKNHPLTESQVVPKGGAGLLPYLIAEGMRGMSVKVDRVTVVNVKGKSKSFRNRAGSRGNWRKAYVRLVDGQSIDVTAKA